MDLQQLRQLNEFAAQFNLTLWVDRGKTWDDIEVVAGAEASKSDTYKTTAGADAEASKSDTYKTTTDVDASKSDTYKTTTDADASKSDTYKTTTDAGAQKQEVASNKQVSNNISLRLGALLYGNVLVIYSLKNRIGIAQDERQLLNSMLDKCGVNMQEYRFAKENILVYPPLIKNLEEVLSQDVNVLKNLVTGFLQALNDRSKATGKELYVLVLGGDGVVEHLPEHSKITPNAPIVLEGLRAMVDEPQKRKVAWEALKPLRAYLGESSAS